mmetsp:Transcript_99150/g.256326  ORF Transcript_99150/g.256326 Transcript_99150/m.256326 type:complete len:580 (+) Transcript_99150:1375-3114(+)
MVDRLLAPLADHRDLQALRRQRQGGVLVRQQDGAVDNRLLGHHLVGGAGDVVEQHVLRHRGFEAAVHLARGVHGGQHVPSHGVHRALLDLALADQRRQLREDAFVAWHLDVQPGRRPVDGVVRRAPVADDVSAEVELLAQEGLEELLVLAGVGAVDLVVRAHDGSRTRVDGRLEGRHVDLVLRAVVHLDVHGHAADLLVVVEPVLDRRDDAPGLDLLDEGPHELAAEVGVLAGQGLEAAARAGHARDLEVRAQEHVRALGDELLGDGGGVGRGGPGVEGGGEGQEAGELRRRARVRAVHVVALRAVVHAQRHGVLGVPRGQRAVHLHEAGEAVAVVGPGVVLAAQQRHLVLQRERREDLLGARLGLDPRTRGRALVGRHVVGLQGLRVHHRRVHHRGGASCAALAGLLAAPHLLLLRPAHGPVGEAGVAVERHRGRRDRDRRHRSDLERGRRLLREQGRRLLRVGAVAGLLQLLELPVRIRGRRDLAWPPGGRDDARREGRAGQHGRKGEGGSEALAPEVEDGHPRGLAEGEGLGLKLRVVLAVAALPGQQHVAGLRRHPVLGAEHARHCSHGLLCAMP